MAGSGAHAGASPATRRTVSRCSRSSRDATCSRSSSTPRTPSSRTSLHVWPRTGPSSSARMRASSTLSGSGADGGIDWLAYPRVAAPPNRLVADRADVDLRRPGGGLSLLQAALARPRGAHLPLRAVRPRGLHGLERPVVRRPPHARLLGAVAAA